MRKTYRSTGVIIRNRCAEIVNSCYKPTQLPMAINYSQMLIEYFVKIEYKDAPVTTKYGMRKYLLDVLTRIVKQKRKLLRSI